MNSRIFREYDIRGRADRDLTDEVVTNLGRAYAELLDPHPTLPLEGEGQGRGWVAIGRDCRLSSPRLRNALIAGIREQGISVIDIGVVPTPILYFAAFHLDVAGAIIVTGSHNPAEDNGFKILRGKSTLHGADIQALGKRAGAGGFRPAKTSGGLEMHDITQAYLDHAAAQLRLGKRRGKVVVDGGNGAGGPTAVALYRRLGFEVIPLYCDMDGTFPNHHPDPTVEKNLADLKECVARERAALGIALDGDGDRIGAIDDRGRVLWGDQLMILFGRKILEEQPGARFIGEVKCSQALFDELDRAGGKAEMWRVGHSLIKARMKETGAALGGEMSGHIFFAHRYLGFDDATYAGARLLEILSQTEKTLADLRDTLPVMVNTPEIRVDCPDDVKFDVVKRATALLRARPEVKSVIDVDGVRANFGDGWGLVRASNTQPALVVRCEAGTTKRLEEIRSIVEAAIASAKSAA